MSECPFKVGDRIYELNAWRLYNGPDVDECSPSNTLDLSKPDATVTAVTEKGFMYVYDTPVPHGRHEWGQMMVGGGCFPEGYAYWQKLEDQS